MSWLQAARTLLRRRRGSSLAVLALLALTGAAAAAVFALLHALVLRPLPYRDDAALVWVWSARPDVDRAFFSVPDFDDFRRQSTRFAGLAGLNPWGPNLVAGERTQRVQAQRLTGDAFDLLGAAPLAGRVLGPADEAAQARVAVLGHALYRRLFGAAPLAEETSVDLDGTRYRVVGVMPPDFVFPGAEPAVELAVPLAPALDPRRNDRGANFIRIVARVRDGVAIDAAAAELAEIAARQARDYPATNAMKLAPRVVPLRAEMSGDLGRIARLLLVAVLALQALVALNLGSLILARAVERQGESALLLALGARRRDVLARLAAEALIPIGAGSALGLALAPFVLAALVGLHAAAVPRIEQASIGVLEVAVVAALALATAALALAPLAAAVARFGPSAEALRGGAGLLGGRRRWHRVLVGLEVALAVVLVSAVAASASTFERLRDLPLGFDPTRAVVARLALPASRYADRAALLEWFDAVERELRADPRVRQVALANALPLSGINTRNDFVIDGHPPLANNFVPSAQTRWITADSFDALGMRVLRGRGLLPTDDERAEPVVVLDETVARRYWPGADPIGAVLTVDGGVPARVVGIARDVPHFTLDEAPRGTTYFSVRQMPPSYVGYLAMRMHLIVAGTDRPEALAPLIERAVARVDRGIAPAGVAPAARLLGAALAPARLSAVLLGALGALALVVAALGVYAVAAQDAALRMREAALKLALGARPARVRRELIAAHLAVCAVGLALGLALSAALRGALLAALGAGARLPVAWWLALLGVLLGATVLAAWLAARRLARASAALVLRGE